MNTQTPQDFERLSAYIDNELSPAEKADLEARLVHEPELKAGLDDLRLTVRALRNLPAVKPPRSFALTPEQVGARARRGPLFPAFRLAAALCVLLLAVAVARDVTTSGSLAASATDNFAVQSSPATGSPATALVVPHAAPLMTLTPGSGDLTSGAAAQVPTDTPEADIATTPAARASIAQPSETPGSKIMNFAPSAGATATPIPQDTSAGVAVPSATAETAASPAPASPAVPSPDPGIIGLRLVEVVLAALALALAAGAWLTRRG